MLRAMWCSVFDEGRWRLKQKRSDWLMASSPAEPQLPHHCVATSSSSGLHWNALLCMFWFHPDYLTCRVYVKILCQIDSRSLLVTTVWSTAITENLKDQKKKKKSKLGQSGVNFSSSCSCQDCVVTKWPELWHVLLLLMGILSSPFFPFLLPAPSWE